MGGLLGPDGGLYHQLGRSLPERGDWRDPAELPAPQRPVELCPRHACCHGVGGPPRGVPLRACGALLRWVPLPCRRRRTWRRRRFPVLSRWRRSRQGCEPIELLGDRDLLFVHGTNDQILPHQASELVRMLAGHGELLLLDGADHMLRPRRFAGARPAARSSPVGIRRVRVRCSVHGLTLSIAEYRPAGGPGVRSVDRVFDCGRRCAGGLLRRRRPRP